VPASLDDSQAVAVTMEPDQPRVAAAAAVRMPSPFNLNSFSVTFTSIRSYPDTFKVCLSAADVDAAVASNPPKIASLIGMEGARHRRQHRHACLHVARARHCAAFDLAGVVLSFTFRYKAGARYMTLTHSLNNAWADSATDNSRLV